MQLILCRERLGSVHAQPDRPLCWRPGAADLAQPALGARGIATRSCVSCLRTTRVARVRLGHRFPIILEGIRARCAPPSNSKPAVDWNSPRAAWWKPAPPASIARSMTSPMSRYSNSSPAISRATKCATTSTSTSTTGCIANGKVSAATRYPRHSAPGQRDQERGQRHRPTPRVQPVLPAAQR